MLVQESSEIRKEREFLDKGQKLFAEEQWDLAIQYFQQLVRMNSIEEKYRDLLAEAELEKAKSQVNFLTRPFLVLWAILLVMISESTSR